MTNDMRIRAQQAKELLKSKAFVDAMRRVRETQVQTFLSSVKGDTEVREKAHSIILALSAIEYELVTAVTDIEMLERKEQKQKGLVP